MDLSLGFLFCSLDLYFCLCASTILSWWLWLCSRAWSRAVDSSSSILLSQDCFGYSRCFCISIHIVKLFVLVLWKMPLVAWWGLHWIYRLLWVIYSFSLYWFFWSMNTVYFSIYLYPLWFLSSLFLTTKQVRLYVNYRKKKAIKNSNLWRLKNTLLNNQQITEEIKKKRNQNMHRK